MTQTRTGSPATTAFASQNMNHVFANVWRPKSFDAVIGQSHVVQALTHALSEGRLHHAYLFTGTRGVGKTSLARIFASCLNCEKGPTAKPCLQCQHCEAIAKGAVMDLIEIDAASRTKVEDTRELLESVQYLPSEARYKIYLIDEVHMLSGHSFNALLKTLEEPPSHVIFLLATTDPQKIPVTVLSRCLQFHLHPLSEPFIVQHLAKILKAEKIKFDEQALKLIAKMAAGSVRDALSLLQQAVDCGAGAVSLAETEAMLGFVPEISLAALLHEVAATRAHALFEGIAKLSERVVDFTQMFSAMMTLLHQVAQAQVLGEWEASQEVLALAEALSPEQVQLYYQIAMVGSRDLPYCHDKRQAFEMMLLRMLHFQPIVSESEASAGAFSTSVEEPPTFPVSNGGHEEKRPVVAPQIALKSTEREIKRERASPLSNTDAMQTVSPSSGSEEPLQFSDWETLLQALKLEGTTHLLAQNCSLGQHEADTITLHLEAKFAPMKTEAAEKRLAAALERHFKKPIGLQIILQTTAGQTPSARKQQAEAKRVDTIRDTLMQDAKVKDLLETFDGKLTIE